MSEMVIPVASPIHSGTNDNGNERLHVAIHIQADVLTPDAAKCKANCWLFTNAGNLVRVDQPQLILDDPLLWRFDICLTIPDLQNPGNGKIDRIGKLDLNAITGEIVIPTTFINDLQTHVDSINFN